MITPKLTQYSLTVYTPLTSLSSVEKYPVIRLTGRNKMVTLASRIVTLVNFSTAWESFRAIKLKFCSQLATLSNLSKEKRVQRREELTRNVRDSFSTKQASISDKQYSLIRSNNRSNLAVAAELN